MTTKKYNYRTPKQVNRAEHIIGTIALILIGIILANLFFIMLIDKGLL